jgi:DNA-binding CsgD family transcriptional regulator
MKPIVYEEAGKIWKRLSKGAMETELQFELEVHRRLLNFFQVGDYYYFIFNIKETVLELVSQEVTAVLGYKPAEFDIPLLMSIIHPDDQSWFLTYESKATEYFFTKALGNPADYKISYDYRVRKKNGDYIRILQQITTIQYDEDKGVVRTFGVHTDITHLKPEGRPVLSFIGLNGAPSYLNVDVKNKFGSGETTLTPREQQVLQLLAQGKSSDAISQELSISKQTVDTHRKNLLKKTGCSNTAALMSEAVKRGWM